HEQVAKLGPVSRAAGMDCECPLYNISVIKQKGKAEKMSGFRMFVELRELSCSHNPKTPQIRS
ncbi:MAG: hypothetical protein ACLU6H_12430, partial [Lachnospiraceae bacterium]